MNKNTSSKQTDQLIKALNQNTKEISKLSSLIENNIKKSNRKKRIRQNRNAQKLTETQINNARNTREQIKNNKNLLPNIKFKRNPKPLDKTKNVFIPLYALYDAMVMLKDDEDKSISIIADNILEENNISDEFNFSQTKMIKKALSSKIHNLARGNNTEYLIQYIDEGYSWEETKQDLINRGFKNRLFEYTNFYINKKDG